MLSDILPTGFECGVLNGQVKPGDTVAIVGAGPIGLAALLTAQFYSPAEIIMIDLDDNRLEVAKRFGATRVDQQHRRQGRRAVMELTGGRGVDTAIEAVGVPATFDICQTSWRRAASSPTSASTAKVDAAPRERLWSRNITHHDAAGRHGHDADAAQDRAVAASSTPSS